jgi:deoxyribonuclease V
MKSFPLLHPWDVTPRDAVAIQNRLRAFVALTWAHPHVRRVAGLDCSYARGADQGYAVVMVMDWPQLDEIEVAWAMGPISFPYIPGLLTFREAPLLLQAWGKLRHHPDLII